MKRISVYIAVLVVTLLSACRQDRSGESTISLADTVTVAREVWTKEHATRWYAKQGWLRGCNFIPSTAINQLEMWQAETFDTATINRELGWAESIGLNAMRVYLHHAAWKVDSSGFKNRVNEYLTIADKHHISTIFVFFDDCWNPEYKTGKQPDPKPGVHNSGWIKDPGNLLYGDSTSTPDAIAASPVMKTLEAYVKDILTAFADDKRIVLWDLYNEPGNFGYKEKSLPLLKNAFTWGRTVNPSQPLSAGLFSQELVEFNQVQLDNSDVITYHCYDVPAIHQKRWIDSLKVFDRPMICTEYMARTRDSRFENIMPMLKQANIGAFNWGFVSGKSNTIYAWDTPMPDGREPKIWFHDILRRDGTPYSVKEVELIKQLTVNN